MRRLRCVFAVCGAGVLLAIAPQVGLAASDDTPSSGVRAKTGKPPAAHGVHPKAARPAAHKTTAPKDQKNEPAARPATAPTGSVDKSLERRPLFGPFSVGVETDPKVKPRSLAGGEVDFEREPGVRSKNDPWFLGLSFKSPVSW